MHSSQAAMKEMTGLQDTTELTKKFEFNPKDGIDNPALSLADDSGGGNIGGTPGRMVHRNLLVNAVPQLVKIQICALAEINEPEEESHVRYCFLKKEDGESFGFCLRQEAGSSGHIVRQVTSGGLAHRRGLRNGDRILEVNGVCVEGMEHLRVVWKIKSSGKQVLLTVLDGNAYDLATALHQDITQFLPPHSRPQLCRIIKDQSGFGFTVSAPEGTKGTFQLSVLRDGPAYKAGVPDRSWLLELNGASVANWTSAQLNKKLKHASSPMGLLVIDGESEEFYRQRGVKVTGAMADASHIPFEVRKLEMVRGPDGYGFLLKEEKRCFGRRGQFLREVDLGMPAEKAGMKDGDRLLAVNGESAEDLDHQEVVLRIRANSHWVTLLVIEAEGSKFFDLVGLSPLLFYDDQDPASVLHTTPTFPPPALKPCQCHLGGRGSSRENGLPLNQPGDGTRAFNTEETEELSQAF